MGFDVNAYVYINMWGRVYVYILIFIRRIKLQYNPTFETFPMPNLTTLKGLSHENQGRFKKYQLIGFSLKIDARVLFLIFVQAQTFNLDQIYKYALWRG